MNTTTAIKAWNDLTVEQQQGYMALVMQKESGRNMTLMTIVNKAISVHKVSRTVRMKLGNHDLETTLFDEA